MKNATDLLRSTQTKYPALATEMPEVLALYERLIGIAEERIGEPRDGWQWFRLPRETAVEMVHYDRLARRGVAEWLAEPSEFRIAAHIQ